MALIVEDGSIVPGANTYISVADFRTYAEMRGIELPEETADVEILLIKAMDYLATYEDRWQGARVSSLQALAWPRRGVVINGFPWPADVIPGALKAGQCAAAVAAQSVDLLPSIDRSEANLKRRKIGSLEREWFDRGAVDGAGEVTPLLAAVDTALAPLLRPFRLGIERA